VSRVHELARLTRVQLVERYARLVGPDRSSQVAGVAQYATKEQIIAFIAELEEEEQWQRG
jgi:hypothetical protein